MSVKSPPGGANVRVLVFHGSAAAGDESPVVNAGIEAIEKIGLTGPANQRFTIEATDDASVFTDEARARQVQRGRLPDRRRRCPRRRAGGGPGGVHGGRRRVRRHPRRGPRRAVLGLVHRTGRCPPGRREPDDRPAGDRRGRRPAAPGHQGPAGAVEAPRPVAELGEEPLGRRAHRGPGPRVDLPAGLGRQRLGPPGVLVPRLRRRPVLLHRHGRHGRRRTTRPTSATICAARCCGRPGSRRPTARRRSTPTTRRSG